HSTAAPQPAQPGVALEPHLVARAGVRQWNAIRQVLAPGANRVGQRRLAPIAEVVRLRVAADEQCQAQFRQMCEQLWMPKRRALRPRRQVPAGTGSREAECGRDDGDTALIVEAFVLELQP